MEYNDLVRQLAPIVTNGAYASSESGKNEITDRIMTYLDANIDKNTLDNANININLVLGRTAVNDMNSQAQSEAQLQYM